MSCVGILIEEDEKNQLALRGKIKNSDCSNTAQRQWLLKQNKKKEAE
jgi:hypothetical protein